ncbi:hypothetical protein QTP88_025779 [Uroleucon formosanum]
MSNRDRDRFRSYESGCKKREKKQIKQDFLKTQQGSFLKFLSKENDKLDRQSDVILATKISTISQVNSEAENLELEREKSPELSPICLKSLKALNKDSELPQIIISNFKESNSVEFQEILSYQALSSLNLRFNQFKIYNEKFGFLFHIGKLKEMEDDELMKNCKDLHIYLMDGEHKDIDGNELYHELQIFKSLMEINTTALQSLSILKKLNGYGYLYDSMF